MPSYKTHFIHGEVIFTDIDKKIEINKEDLKTFCMGPDVMICTGYKIFDFKHDNSVKEYFETLLKKIKDNKLQENSEVMAFLYGQLDHYILDVIMHPFILYITKKMNVTSLISAHSLLEMWIDDYIKQKFGKSDGNYSKCRISDSGLQKLIDFVYKEVYNASSISLKYKLGTDIINAFDLLVRKNSIIIAKLIIKIFNIGDITYHKDIKHVEPYLNFNKDIWYNISTREECRDSFDDLWQKSVEISLEAIQDANRYLYQDKPLTNKYILKNISYNTGLPCKVKNKISL